MRRFDCYPDDFLSGTQGLGPILGWAYTRLFMKMYSEDGPLDYDPHKLKYLLEMRPQDVRKVVMQLCEKGKLFLVDGQLHNKRTNDEITKFRKNDPSGNPLHDGQMKLHFPGHNSEKPNDSTRARAPASPSPSPSKESFLFNGKSGDVAPRRRTNDWDMPSAPGPSGQSAFLANWKPKQH